VISKREADSGPLSERGRNWLDLPTFPVEALIEVQAEDSDMAKSAVTRALVDSREKAELGFSMCGRIGAFDLYDGDIEPSHEIDMRDESTALAGIAIASMLVLAVAFGYWLGAT
jgi:hypothetical protein